jgi:UDP-glucuronate 4-epimerase
MPVFVIGGTGFIGYRLVRRLVARGETVTCMDSNLEAHSFVDLGTSVSCIRGDVARFEDVLGAMTAAKADRVVNLAYLIGGNYPPHLALRINILGTDNCFEAARRLGVKHTVYAGSFAPNGKQSNYGDRDVTEDDPLHGEYQYARHKIMNEWQALDYAEKYAMCITGIRAAYVTGPDKVRGTTDHVRCITEPALWQASTLAFQGCHGLCNPRGRHGRGLCARDHERQTLASHLQFWRHTYQPRRDRRDRAFLSSRCQNQL